MHRKQTYSIAQLLGAIVWFMAPASQWETKRPSVLIGRKQSNIYPLILFHSVSATFWKNTN